MPLLIGCDDAKSPYGNPVATVKDIIAKGADAIQITLRELYSSAKGTWLTISTTQAAQIRKLVRGKYFIAHGSYMVNLAAPLHRNIWALDMVVDDMKTMSRCGGYGVVVHLGSRNVKRFKMTMSTRVATNNMLEAVAYILKHTPKKSILILETVAGLGTDLCSRLPELGRFYARIPADQRKRVRICVDTSHIFVAGYKIDSVAGMRRFWRQYDQHLGRESLTCIQLNDPLAADKDRHGVIGEGLVFGGPTKRRNAILRILFDLRVPIILETHDKYRQGIAMLKQLAGPQTGSAYANDKIAALFAEMAHYQRLLGDAIRANSYDMTVIAINSLERPIRSIANVEGVPGIGAKSRAKIGEILETGTFKALERLRADPELQARAELLGVYGIGEKKVAELLHAGIRSLPELKRAHRTGAVHLTADQLKGVKYYADLQERVPRAEIAKYEKRLRTLFPKSWEVVMTGSYRRGLPDSHDMDMVITSKSWKTAKNLDGVMGQIIGDLQEAGLLVDTLSVGRTKLISLVRLTPKSKVRHLDILLTTYPSFPTALFYFTGPRRFSIWVRKTWKKRGYTINEHAIRRGKSVVPVSNEADIFRELGMPPMTPQEREHFEKYLDTEGNKK